MARRTDQLELRAPLARAATSGSRGAGSIAGHAARRGRRPLHEQAREIAGVCADLHHGARARRVQARDDDLGQRDAARRPSGPGRSRTDRCPRAAAPRERASLDGNARRAGPGGRRGRRPGYARPRLAADTGHRRTAPPGAAADARGCGSTRRSRRARGRRGHRAVRQRDVLRAGRAIAALVAARGRRGAARHGPRHAAARRCARCARPDADAPTELPQRLLGPWLASRPRERRGPVRAGLRARLAGGGEAHAELARIPIAPVGRAGPGARAGAARPRRSWPSAWRRTSRRSTLFRRQVDSIRAQTHPQLGLRRQRRLLGRRERFAAVEASLARRPALRALARRRGGSASTATSSARSRSRPAAAELRRAGRPGRRLAPGQARDAAGAIGDARLVYSDARIVDRRTAPLLADTYWSRRRNNHADLLSLLVANAVTGAASLFRARPPRRRASLPARPVRPLPRPLDRALRAGAGRDPLRRPPALRLRPARRRGARPRGGEPHAEPARAARGAAARPARAGPAVAHALLRRRLPAAAAGDGAVHARAGAAWRRPSARALEPVRARPTARSPRSPAWRRGARASSSGAPETLGAEWMLLHAFGWRRLLGASARDRPAAPPAARRGPAAGARSTPGRARARRPRGAGDREKIAPLRLAVRDDAPDAAEPADPDDRPGHFFGGYIAKLNLARRLAAFYSSAAASL